LLVNAFVVEVDLDRGNSGAMRTIEKRRWKAAFRPVPTFFRVERGSGVGRFRSLMGQWAVAHCKRYRRLRVSAFSTCSCGTRWGELGAERLG